MVDAVVGEPRRQLVLEVGHRQRAQLRGGRLNLMS
jgi:hypothetical protein